MPTAIAEMLTAWGMSSPLELESASESGWPLLALPISAGSPVPADDRIERRLSLDTHLARIPEATFLLRVSGDALTEAGIRDGDLLVMDRALPAIEGSVVLALIEGAFLLAGVSGDAAGRRVLLLADGTVSNTRVDDAVIVGVARWAIHRLWPVRHGSD